jgi:predicted enzyme related to lactoylglutathione lyase
MGRPVTQFQILSKNPERSASFYSSLFGWTIDADNPLGYRRIRTGAGRGIEGGIWPAPPEAHAFVQLFVEVEDVAATVEKAKGLGAKVIIPVQALPQGESMAVIADAEGLPVALFKPA